METYYRNEMVKAIRWDGKNHQEISDALRQSISKPFFLNMLSDDTLIIPLENGEIRLRLGDYLVQQKGGIWTPRIQELFEKEYVSLYMIMAENKLQRGFADLGKKLDITIIRDQPLYDVHSGIPIQEHYQFEIDTAITGVPSDSINRIGARLKRIKEWAKKIRSKKS